MGKEPNPVSTMERRSLWVATAIFLLGGFAAFQDGDRVIATASGVAALSNFLALKLLDRFPDNTRLAVFGVNAALAFLMSFAAFEAGKKGALRLAPCRRCFHGRGLAQAWPRNASEKIERGGR